MTCIQNLLENACASIRYRIRTEILGEVFDPAEMSQLQSQIIADEWVQKVISWQQPDGWIGRDFHGENSMETGIRVLCEKGLSPTHPVLTQAITTLKNEEKRLIRGIGKVGAVLDDRNLGGTRMIQAVVLAYAGVEELPLVKDQINKAIQAFQATGSIQSIEGITTMYRDKLVFKPNVVWPSIYHLRLLAFTHSWRTPENLKTLAMAIQRLVHLSPIPEILARSKSQLIAPASFCMLDFNPDMRNMKDSEWMLWFHRMELLVRIGVTHRISELKDQLTRLEEMLISHEGRFPLKLNHYYFRKWSPYSGLMLEKDWRDPKRRFFDLTFRSQLILHYYRNNTSTNH